MTLSALWLPAARWVLELLGLYTPPKPKRFGRPKKTPFEQAQAQPIPEGGEAAAQLDARVFLDLPGAGSEGPSQEPTRSSGSTSAGRTMACE